MQCLAMPYEGNEPYIFFSYSHKDAERVYPLLEQMVRDGYRVWYDDGNHAGDDWLENIANHLDRCAVCLAMLSKNSEESHNCKKEVSFAVQCQKKLMAVMLENFKMTVGMRLQLSTIHYLNKEDYPSDNALLQKLYESECLNQCRGIPGSLPMRTPAEPVVKQPQDAPEKEQIGRFLSSEMNMNTSVEPEVPVSTAQPVVTEEPISTESPAVEEEPVVVQSAVFPEETAAPKKRAKRKIRAIAKPTTAPAGVVEGAAPEETEPAELPAEPEQPAVEPVVLETVPQAEPVIEAVVVETPAEVAEEPPYTADEDKTIFISPEPEADDSATVTMDQAAEDDAILIRMATRQVYPINSALTRMGRSESRCDVVITNNLAVSNYHADLICYKGAYYLKDVGSSNGSSVGTEPMEENKQVKLEYVSLFSLSDEKMLLLYGPAAAVCRKLGTVAGLLNPETLYFKLIPGSALYLDRNHKWEDGTFASNRVSREHAVIHAADGSFALEDVGSRNGTYINGVRAPGKEKTPIKHDDTITMSDWSLKFVDIKI